MSLAASNCLPAKEKPRPRAAAARRSITFGNALGNSIVGHMRFRELPSDIQAMDANQRGAYEAARRNGLSDDEARVLARRQGQPTDSLSGLQRDPRIGDAGTQGLTPQQDAALAALLDEAAPAGGGLADGTRLAEADLDSLTGAETMTDVGAGMGLYSAGSGGLDPVSGSVSFSEAAADSVNNGGGLSSFGAKLPSLPQDLVDFSAGLGDSLLFGFGDDLRGAFDIDGGIDRQSGYYLTGELTSFAAGGSRLLYAGGAKGASLIGNGLGGLRGAEFAVNSRNSLKALFRGGLFPNYRKYPAAQVINKYGTDGAISAAGRTNKALNATGAGLAGGASANEYDREK